jgi:hypothetical protein
MTNGILNMVVPLGWYYSISMETFGGCRTKKRLRIWGQTMNKHPTMQYEGWNASGQKKVISWDLVF